MRFIINFILFGMLFFIIYRFLPDAFSTLVTWANAVFDAGQDVVLWLMEKVKAMSQAGGKA